jgi:hypothetical protein
MMWKEGVLSLYVWTDRRKSRETLVKTVSDIAEIRFGHLPNTRENSSHLSRGIQRLVLKLNPIHKDIFSF